MMEKAFVSVWLLLVLCVFQFTVADDLIEPTVRMIDRSPGFGRNAAPAANPHQMRVPPRPLPQRPGLAGRPNKLPAFDMDGAADEAISFSVNTRHEFGDGRAPLFCNCQVLSVLTEDEVPQKNEFGEVVGRRSYTAPELRAHVPLVTPEYAADHDQISFGVNVRGEEGPELNPTWCTCKILPVAKAPVAEDADGDADGEEQAKGDDDDETPAVSNPRGGAGGMNPRGPRAIPGRRIPDTTGLQIDEGSELPTKLDDQSTSEKIVESTMNLQEVEGVVAEPATANPAEPAPQTTETTQTQQVVSAVPTEAVTEQKTEQSAVVDTANLVEVKAVATGPATHRHSWRHGVDVPQQLVQEEHKEVNTHGVETSKPKANQVAGDVEYLFHGHKFSATGKQLDAPKVAPPAPRSIAEEVATQILTQLEEGRNPPPQVVVETDNAENTTTATPSNIPILAVNTTKATTNTSQEVAPIVEIATAPATEAANASVPATEIAPSALVPNVTVTSNATGTRASENSDEDSEQEDAVQALQHLARSHPHASAILSRALEMAAMQQRSDFAKLQSELAAKDRMIHDLAIEKQKAEQAAKKELEIVEKMQAFMLRTATPSPTPSVSASMSESPSASPSASPLPSPSPSEIHRHHHHRPRVNKNACYHKCRESECTPLFEQSLRQYASCTDQCAAKCYGA